MTQPKGFAIRDSEHLAYQLKKPIYELKLAFRQWYIKFDQIVSGYDFRRTLMTCIFLKSGGSSFVILIFYVVVIVLACNEVRMLHEVKHFLSKSFDMEDTG